MFPLTLETKHELQAVLLGQLREELQAVTDAQMATQAGANHSEAKQEGSKDTRAIEARYLARGLAARVEQMRDAVARVEAVRLRVFTDDDPVEIGAIVHLEEEDDEVERVVWILSAAGGAEVIHGDVSIQVVTPRAPLGRALIGQLSGDVVIVETPRGRREWLLRALG